MSQDETGVTALLAQCKELDKRLNGEPDSTAFDVVNGMVVRTLGARSLIAISNQNEELQGEIVRTLEKRNKARGIDVPRMCNLNISASAYYASIELQYEYTWSPVSVGREQVGFIQDDGSLYFSGGIFSGGSSIPFKNRQLMSVLGDGFAVGQDGIVEKYAGRSPGQCVYSELMDTGIMIMSAGEKHTLIVTRGGKLLCKGDNILGQCGGSAGEDNVGGWVNPQRQPNPPRVCGASAGNNHSLFVTDIGEVWAFGDDAFGQVSGTPKTGSAKRQMFMIPRSDFDTQVVQVAAGANHSLALTIDGNVYAWGDDESGQLGGAVESGMINSMHFGNNPVQLLAAGGNGSCAVAQGQLFTWGAGVTGRLGLGSKILSQPTPQLVKGALSGKRVIAVATGANATIAVVHDGSVFGWGLRRVLGLGPVNDVIWDPCPYTFKCVTTLPPPPLSATL